jgi:hypothetical protein
VIISLLGIPPLMKIDDGTHPHPQAKKKKKELDFLPRLGDGAHQLPKTTKKKEKKRELTFVES